MTVDISKIKIGDKITAEIVVGEPWGLLGFRTSGSKDVSYFNNCDIISHTPKPIEPVVGVKFRHKLVSSICTIVAIIDNDVVFTWKGLETGKLFSNILSLEEARNRIANNSIPQGDLES